MYPAILTKSGNYIDFVDFTNNEYYITDIAHALSNVCRFSGHTRTFYSVAQHSVLVSLLVPKEYALEGLLHDMTEAYIGDMSSPLKSLFQEFKDLEKRLYAHMSKTFDVPETIRKEVVHGDLVALATEKRDLMLNEKVIRHWGILDGIIPDFDIIQPLTPTEAYTMFMTRYQSLTASGVKVQ